QRHRVLGRRASAVGVLVPQLQLPVDQVVVGVGPVVGAAGDLLVGVGLALGVHDLGLEHHGLIGAVGVVHFDDEVADGVHTSVLAELLDILRALTGHGDGGDAPAHQLGLVDARAILLNGGLLLDGLFLFDGLFNVGGLDGLLFLDDRSSHGLSVVGDSPAACENESGGV